MTHPLKGIHVVTLALNLPGPIACAELQKMGATITKVEPPTGDQLEAAFPDWYRALTSGQSILKLDLTQTDDRKRLESALTKTDLLITASRPAFLKKIGLDWQAIHKKHPRLCYVGIVGYPAPNEDQPGHDLTYQAEMGLIDPPRLPRTLLADIAGAEKAVTTALALLLERERSGHASHSVIALSDAVIPFLEPMKYRAVAPKAILGGGHPGYNIYKTKDGWIALAALEEKYWKRVTTELNGKTHEQLEQIFLTRTSKAWETWAREKDIPLVAIKT